MKEIKLKSGKKVTLREKTGNHKLLEARLLNEFAGPNGVDTIEGTFGIGAVLALSIVQTVTRIESIDGTAVALPSNYSDMIIIMSGFTEAEWNELEMRSKSRNENYASKN